MICKICKKEIKSNQALSKHIKNKHDINQKQYYDKFYKKSDEGFCNTCGKITPFLGLSKGYQKHCCSKCAQIDPQVDNVFVKRNPRQLKPTENRNQTFIKVDFTCQLCNKRFNNNRSIANHMRYHNTTSQDYWKKFQTATCKICGQPTKFINGAVGYSQYCCLKHKNLDLFGQDNNPHKYDKRRLELEQKRKQFEQQNNVISYMDAIKLYGQGWRVIQDSIQFVYFTGIKYIPKSELHKIKAYVDVDHYKNNSKEQELVSFIKSFYSGQIITHARKIIKPKELDIYLPDIQLAIEFNGVFFHSIQNNVSKTYHLDKSLACRQKGIRLIHIYEFENLETQKTLLKSLILGTDLYPKQDFNKNNLITKIPKAVIIYKDARHTLYGAGKLY